MSTAPLPDPDLLLSLRHAAIASAPLAVTATDEQGHVVLWNHAAEELFGWPRDEVLGRPLVELDVVPEDEAERFQQLRARALAGETIDGYVEGIRRRRDGSSFQARIWPAPLRGEDGALRGFVGYVADVTDERQREARRRADEERFRAIFDGSHAAILIFDPDADELLDANASAGRLFGCSHDELLTRRPSDIHPHEVPAFRAFVERVRAQGAARTDQLSCLDHRGEPVPCEISASSITLAERSWVVAVIRDVRERRRMEAELQAAEQRYRDLYERAPFAYVSVDREGRVQLANERAQELLGHAELVGEHVLDLYHPEGPEGRSRAEELLERYREGEEIRHEELRMLAADGRTVWTSLSVTPVVDEDGQVVASRSIIEDITARKLAEQQLARSLEELEQANAELTQMAFGVAHDLSAPLRTVSTYSQLLRRELEDRLDPRSEELLDFIAGGVERLRTLLDGLLAFAQAGEHRPTVDEVDLTALVEQTSRVLAATIEETGAEVGQGELPRVRGDEDGLGQVLQNLIGNALRFPTPGSPPRVRVEAIRERDAWRIEVADEGPGIDAASRERIFDMFHRAEDPAHRQGAGIGLAICRKVVERHGGRIWVRSAPGEGSTFCFTLPDEGPGPVADAAG